MDKLKYKARAKVNLGLDVCGRLPNGYHKVKMIMQAIDLYDELEFNKRKDPDIILSVDSKDPLGDIGNNLIFRAAKLMKEYYSIKEGIEIHLKKHIPVAAGMAGLKLRLQRIRFITGKQLISDLFQWALDNRYAAHIDIMINIDLICLQRIFKVTL